MATTVELWTDLECAGGSAVGALTIVSGQYSEVLDGSDTLTLRIDDDARARPALRQVLRVTGDDASVREYRVQSTGAVSAERTREIKGVSPLADLATLGRVRSVTSGLTSWDVGGRYTATEVLALVVADLVALGVTWWDVGTVDSAGYWDVAAPTAGWSHLEWLRTVQGLTGHELRAVRDGASGYLLDLRERIGASAAAVSVSAGKNLLAYEDTQDDVELTSAITVLGGVPEGAVRPVGLGENAWAIGTVPGSAPYWIPLTDPAGGAHPIAFDGQFGTAAGSQPAYLLLSDATTLQITDSRASDGAVLVAATTGLTAGHHAQIVADAGATRLTELRAPNTARLHRTDVVADANAGRNLLRNGLFLDWSSVSAPALWTAQGGTFNVGEYPRGEPSSIPAGMVVNGFTASGAPGLAFRGAPAGARFFQGEYLVVTRSVAPFTAQAFRVGNVIAEASGSGTGSIVFLSSTTTVDFPDGSTFAWFGQEPKRPSAFPVERDTNAILRVLTTGPTTIPPSPTGLRLQSEAFRVKYLSSLARLNVLTAWTLHNGSGSDIGNTDAGAAITDDLATATARNLPGVMLRNNATNARLGWSAMAPRVPAGVTMHGTVGVQVTLSADTTVDVCLLGGDTTLWQGCRWVTLWVGDATTLNPYPGSWDNLRWQRANRALLARKLTSRQLTVTLAQLSAAAGYSLTREALTLGGSVVLEDLGLTVRVVAMTIDVHGGVSVTLDSRPRRLTELLAERL